MLPYALTIFTGAFLLFQVQPLIGKFILPWFGGGPGVWTTCLLFFQTLLLGGYAYAHFTSTRLKPKTQAVVHAILLVLSLVMLPIAPSDAWKQHVAGDPTWQILLLLTMSIGLPYLVLSSTGPLMQHWFSRTNPGISPYRLYALSNVGSLLALLSYPAFFEVKFSRHAQANLWSGGLVVFVLFCGYCAWLLWKRATAPVALGKAVVVAPAAQEIVTARPVTTEADVADSPAFSAPISTTSAEISAPSSATSGVDKLLWMALPALASVLLLATTNKLSQEIAVIPFLWVLPLSLYLLTFIICFDHARWYHRGLFTALLVVGMAVVAQLIPVGTDAPMRLQIIAYTGTLFIACMVCHGELYRLKPAPERLTSYFLYISAGGALGGFLVAIVAPAVFNDYRELQLGFWLLSYLVGVLCYRHRSREIALAAGVGALLTVVVLPWIRSQFDDSEGMKTELLSLLQQHWMYLVAAVVVFVACTVDFRGRRFSAWQPRTGWFVMFLSVGLGVVFVMHWAGRTEVAVLSASRNFYGTLKVFNYNPNDEEDNYHLLLHGATTHGIQFTAPKKSVMPTTYYADSSGVGRAINALPQGPRRMGLVGLGTGTLAAYGRQGDYLRIYEINPDVEKLARQHFKYLEYCPAKLDVVMGDARLTMEQEVETGKLQKFDLLALDAFSSDAIPVHLLTKEAFDLYLKQVKPDGVIAVHISNRYLNLRPVVEKLAEHFGLEVATISDDNAPDWWIYATTWMLLSKNKELMAKEDIREVAEPAEPASSSFPLWTDDFASLYSIMK